MDVTSLIWTILWSVIEPLLSLWWLWLLIVLIPLIRSTYDFIQSEQSKAQVSYTLLELRMPREVTQSPKAMQQVLSVMSTLSGSWHSLEIAAFEGQSHYYIRTDVKLKPIIEASIFSYYPTLEVAEVEDYVLRLPADITEAQERGWDIWGQELILKKPGIFPIKSYVHFEGSENKDFDPMSIFLEMMAKLKPDEFLGIQFIISPKDAKWADIFKEELDKLKENKKNPDGTPIERTPGQAEIIKAAERNAALPAFETYLRVLYAAPKTSFADSFASKAIMGAFNQFGSFDLNFFVSSKRLETKVRGKWYLPGPLSMIEKRVLHRKAHLLSRYRRREVPPKSYVGLWLTSTPFYRNLGGESSVLTIESLATLFHPPTARVVTAPHIKRVDSKKGGPPAGLAIFGEEADIQKYLQQQ